MESTLDALVARIASRGVPRTEADLQSDVKQLLLAAPLDLSEVMLEAPAGERRRIDVEVGSTVIEVKTDLGAGGVLAEAEEQLRGYVAARQARYECRYAGILTDGASWRCYQLEGDRLAFVTGHQVRGKQPDTNALVAWLEGVLATTRDVKPTPDVIARRLGAGSSAYQLDRAGVAALFRAHGGTPEVQTKRRLWARLLQTALGTQFQDDDALFIEHTLLVNSAEIIAHGVIGLDLRAVAPRMLLSGESFDEVQVYGVVERDFFDWIIDVPGGEAFIRALSRRIARFDWSAVEHDVLKVLYESVIGSETRKKLGEYYTPDWLAERTVAEAIDAPLEQRVLDPSCGSGTFLFHAIRRYLEAASAQKKKPRLRDQIESVTSYVLGMDLHPVAVTLARVTYLLALGRDRLLAKGRGPIRIPVFLGDSMQWRQPEKNLLSQPSVVRIVADDGREVTPPEFRFPRALLENARQFDETVRDLTSAAADRDRHAPRPPIDTQLEALSAHDRKMLQETFELMCRLHDEGRNHVWGYYIRNHARPEWLELEENRVDVLIGNPPWLSYRFMPAAMQRIFAEMSESRGLWHGARHATQQDLSALFVARAIQLYLRKGGRFAFVMPAAVLDRGQYAGFRKGDFDEKHAVLRVHFDTPWDLRRLRPHFFPVAACVVFGRHAKVARPIPESEYWTGRLPAGNASWKTVAPLLTTGEAAPPALRGPGSEYKEIFHNGATIFPRILFMVDIAEPGPLGLASGTLRVRSSRSATEKAPWKDLPAMEGVVESIFVRRIHMGETVLPYRLLEPRRAVIPRDNRGLMDTANPRLMSYRGLAKWWRRVDALWLAHRSSERLTLLEQLDYHQKFTRQFPFYPPRVFYCKSGMHLAAAWCDDRRVHVDHTLYWMTARSLDEARYLCAILNAAVTTEVVRPLMAYGKDERHIDKFVWQLPITRFDPEDKTHKRIVKLSQQVEEAIAELELPEALHFAAQRRQVREAMAELKAAQQIEELVAEMLGRA